MRERGTLVHPKEGMCIWGQGKGQAKRRGNEALAGFRQAA